MLLLVSAAFATEGISRCTAKLQTPGGAHELQAFGPDFEQGMARAVEHAWLVAEVHQHADVHLGDVHAFVERYAAIEPPTVPRLPGYAVREGSCEVVQVQRHAGDWQAGWQDTWATADTPWLAVEIARRRHCFSAYDAGVAADLQQAGHALVECLQQEVRPPTPAVKPLPPTESYPRYLCVHEEGWVGGGVSLVEAQEDALEALIVGRSRRDVGAALAAVEAQEPTPAAAYDLLHESREAELAALSCGAPDRNLRFTTTSRCAGSSRTLTATLEVTSAEISSLCHAAHYEPTLSMLPSTVESGLPTHLSAGAVGLANRCDAACRGGFR